MLYNPKTYRNSRAQKAQGKDSDMSLGNRNMES